MSDEVRQTGRGSRTLGVVARWAKAAAVVAAVLVLGGLLLLYGLRTPVVMSEIVGPKIAAELDDTPVRLEVSTMGAAGLTGVRMYDVTAGVDDRRTRSVVRADRVDVYPDFGASILEGRPVVRTVEVGTAQMAVTRPTVDERTDDSPTADTEPTADAEPAAAPDRPATLDRWFADRVDVRVDEWSVRGEGFGQPVVLQGAEVTLDVQDRRIAELDAGARVGGFDVELGADDEQLFAALSSDSIDEAVGELPVDVQLGRIAVDHSAVGEFVRTRRLEALAPTVKNLVVRPEAGDSVELTAEDSAFSAGDGVFGWQARQADLQARGRNYELRDLELTYRPDAPGMAFRTVVGDGRGGTLDLEGNWHVPTSMVDVNAWARDFRWEGTAAEANGTKMAVESLRVDGAFHGDVDLVHRLVSVDGEATLRDLTLDVPLVAAEPMTFDELEVVVPLTADLSTGAFSVAAGTVRMDDVTPLEFTGRVVETQSGARVFDVSATGRDIDAPTLQREVPEALLGVVGEAELEGSFGFGIQLKGHTAYPESLVLEVDFDGDVQVLEEVGWGERAADDDRHAMLVDPASPDRLNVQGQWTNVDQLPEHVPASVLAAEDAAFFEHDGLDWRGLEMAMEENLEEGELARGGSTITQQLAKNLFLNHERTIARKLQEAFLTWRLEETLAKEEILELYLNVVEWGPGIRGLFAASHHFFDYRPRQLEPVEIVMLASILPNPIHFGGAVQKGYLPSSREDKMRRVLENLRFLEELTWEEYQAAIAELDEGRIGRRSFQICADDETAPPGARDCSELEVATREGEEMTFEPWEVAESTEVDGWTPLTH